MAKKQTPKPGKATGDALTEQATTVKAPDLRERYPAPSRRHLRIYALDPSLGQALNSYEDQIATISIRNEAGLMPGPVGEYIEVVDVDPASNRFYPPVDLNHPHVLMQSGLPPSEGNPQFHQQMAYAVAMRTIEYFELGLGRRAQWAGLPAGGGGGKRRKFVQRLRIYPHATRKDNAAYSPDRRALLFGYFQAESLVTGLTPPGTMVFTCLSSDIIAHETTHALLDGQTEAFREPSNPDVRAFHEGFADIVALFQQFSYRELVERQIARHPGKLSASELLGSLARQFGEGTGNAGPLRNYTDTSSAPPYETTFHEHLRGSILVQAVYSAFLAIVERRTSDLLGVAAAFGPHAQTPPEIVSRLTDETVKAAQHVLKMCIRAIDYTPPIDITFGEYLRAIITADLEVYPDDENGYRVAFLEAFRRHRLLPRNLRTVSSESLCWNRVQCEAQMPKWLRDTVEMLGIDLSANFSRQKIHEVVEARRWVFHSQMLKSLNGEADWAAFGLEEGLTKYAQDGAAVETPKGRTTFLVDDLRIARRQLENGDIQTQLIIVVRQRCAKERNDFGAWFWFRGGARIVIDLDNTDGKPEPKLRYVIRKPISSAARCERERLYRNGIRTAAILPADADAREERDALRETYFPTTENGHSYAAREPFAMIHADKD